MRPAGPSASRLVLALAGLLLASAPVRADAPRVRIVYSSVGFPDARGSDVARGSDPVPICKFAAWSPLDVELELLAEVSEPARLVVESPDADGVNTTLALPLDLSSARVGVAIRKLAYVRPAAGSGETTITIRTADGVALSEPFRIRTLRPRDSLTYVVLALGSRLLGFDLPKATANVGEAEASTGPLRGGRVELAAITDVDALPDQWFGYEAADLVVLSTSSEEFVKRLFATDANPQVKKKLAALREWVNRGGRLVIALGVNAALATQLPLLLELLPYRIAPEAPTRQVTGLPLYWSARESSQTSTMTGNLTSKGAAFPVANFLPKPSRPGRVVVPPANRAGEERDAVAVQAGSGLGRVTAIGFDLDRSPFTEFSRRAEFWDWVLREGGASRASVGSEGKPRPLNAGPTDDEDEVAVALRTHLDTFEAVPVVSFAWVAVLIVLYIVLIGPIEYYFLKRVLGRLELTWITFPIIVLTVCIAAYLTALSLKGRVLRANKLDVIDVVAEFDPLTNKHGGRVYGTTWATAFSPKIDTYTVGVTPAEGWTVRGESGASLVGWMGGPRSGRANLLRRRYAYHTDGAAVADGLDGVPIQIWSTKSFQANWTGTIDPAAPVVESHLVHPAGDPSKAIGTFVNRMPFDAVTDCVAFYAGQAYPLGTILSGQEVRLVLDRGMQATQWLQERGQLADLLGRGNTSGGATAGTKTSGQRQAPISTSTSLPLWGLLFHEAALRNDEGVIPRNASLRRLDQSWRLAPDNRDEVIVVGRVLPPSGPMERLYNGSMSPSRLGLKPGQTALPGFARQEAYVRLYLPVK